MSESETELKRCPIPWCAGEAQLMTDELNYGCKKGTVMCMTCFITGPEAGDWRDAITVWNTRPDDVESSQWELIHELNKTIEARDAKAIQLLKDKEELMEVIRTMNFKLTGAGVCSDALSVELVREALIGGLDAIARISPPKRPVTDTESSSLKPALMASVDIEAGPITAPSKQEEQS